MRFRGEQKGTTSPCFWQFYYSKCVIDVTSLLLLLLQNAYYITFGTLQGQIVKAFADLLQKARGKGAPLACDGQSISPIQLKELIAKDESHYFDDSLQVGGTPLPPRERYYSSTLKNQST